MKVESVEIKNFKAISAQALNINGNNVYVVGGNGKGKTSFLDAIFKILHGKDMPAKLVKDGEKNGSVQIDMGEYIIRATFNAKNEKVALSVESPDGAIFKSPRTMLDQLVGVVDFNINDFFALTPKKQVEFIKQLCGIDFSDLDQQYKELFEERTFVNRKVKELEAQLPAYDASKTEKVDVSELIKQVQELHQFNFSYDQVIARINERNLKMVHREQRIQQLLAEVDTLTSEIDHDKDLNRQANEWLGQNQKVDVSVIQAKISQAEAHNAEVERAVAGKAKYDELAAAIRNQEHLNARLAEIQEAKRKAISEAKLPVPGLTFDDDQLFLNGLPFERNQINTAATIIAGLQIQLALLGEVKIARFDGSLLDQANLEAVEAWARDNDLQLFVELVDRSGEGLKIEVREDQQQYTHYAQEVAA